jgi:hypothetical protein
MEVLFFCCFSLCCCSGSGLEPWVSEEPGDACCWPRDEEEEGGPVILGRQEAGGGTACGEGALGRKASSMEEVAAVAW